MQKKPYIIVLGNEKGGTGKSTLAMHIAVSLIKPGFKVGTIDVDARQGSLSRYIANRKAYVEQKQVDLGVPSHYALFRSSQDSLKEAEIEETEKFENCLEELKDHDFIVIDTPGSDFFLSRLAHSYADTLITPINDSFIDLDMLVRVGGEDFKELKPSVYAEMVWDQRKRRAMRQQKPLEWIVARNRLSNLYSRNKEEIQRILEMLSRRIGFKLGKGFGERVIFRELFLVGLTLLDYEDDMALTVSHLAARQELRQLLQLLSLPENLSSRLEVA
jgi:chromosome partitioning protein